MTAYSLYTDLDLVGLLAQDDQLAFEELYTRHWATLYQSAFFILRDKDACMDMVQDVFAWMWEHRHTLQVKSVKAYLKAAVRFKMANYIRSGRVRDSFFQELANYTPSTLPPGSEELAEAKELQTIIQHAIVQLPQKCQEIFRLSREERLSNQEIANRLGVSVKTVENQMTIALKRLRSKVEPLIGVLLLILCGS